MKNMINMKNMKNMKKYSKRVIFAVLLLLLLLALLVSIILYKYYSSKSEHYSKNQFENIIDITQHNETKNIMLITATNNKIKLSRPIKSLDDKYFIGHYGMCAPLIFWQKLLEIIKQ